MAQMKLADWLADQDATLAVRRVILSLADAGAEIADVLGRAPLDGQLGAAGHINVQGEMQQNLDVISDGIMQRALADCADVAAMVSEEVEGVILNDQSGPDATLAVCFDPLDGSSNLATNGTVGSIFSVLALDENSSMIDASAILSAARNQIAAGYILYGPATLLMVTLGRDVAMFALGEDGFLLVQDAVRIPEQAKEFSINMAYQRFWRADVTRYIADCVRGVEGPRGKNFNMRWMGAMVADMHRIFMGGGIFIYPALTSRGGEQGKLRMLYEVNPMAMLIEVAGGRAIVDRGAALAFQPQSIHQRVPFAGGSSEEISQLLSAAPCMRTESGKIAEFIF